MGEVEEEARVPRPTLPLWLIVLAPLLTVPLTQGATQSLVNTDACANIQLDFIGGSASCQTTSLVIALAPGLINLAPLLWGLSKDLRTRKVALLAGILGAVRLVMPAAALLASGPTSKISWGFLQAYPNDQGVVGASIFLWLVSLVALIVVGVPGMRRMWRTMWAEEQDGNQRRLS
jgi:hypothetical protein